MSSRRFSQPRESTIEANGVFGYKLVGDNIDISVNTRFMRAQGYRNQSLHFFHSCAVLDRIDLTHLPLQLLPTCHNSPEKMAHSLLPSPENDASIIQNIAILIGRVLVTHMKYFSFTFSESVPWHICHKYYAQMSSKSQVVSFNLHTLKYCNSQIICFT